MNVRLYCLVPKKGLEPPHPCEYMDLNHARLPIPPLRPVFQRLAARQKISGSPYSYKDSRCCQHLDAEEISSANGEPPANDTFANIADTSILRFRS